MLPPPDDMDVQVDDSTHFSFFLNEVPQFMGCVCCLPQMVDILMQSVNQPILRFSILALSSAVQQAQGGVEPLDVNRNIKRIIPLIQQAIVNVKINNSHLISVTFLAWSALTTCDFPAARRHLRGLVSMLKVTHHLSATAQYIRQDPNPLAMFLFCMGVKVDNYLASRNQPFVIPPIQYNEDYHRQWLRSLTTSETHLHYFLASLQLDCFANNVGHLQRHANRLRSIRFPDAEADIHQRIEAMKMEHKRWVSRPHLQHHIRSNELPQRSLSPNNPEPPIGSGFLSQPEYIVFDTSVAYMHMHHTSLTILMNIVQAGHIDPEDDESQDAAVLIGRIYAALTTVLGESAGKIVNGCTTSLWFAGIVFAHPMNKSPDALQWITHTLREIDKGSRYKSATRIADALLEINCTQGDPWEIVGQKFNTTKGKGPDIGDSDSPTSVGSGVG